MTKTDQIKAAIANKPAGPPAKAKPTPPAKPKTEPEIISRFCGCPAVFVPTGDKHDDARRTKMRKKRCVECGAAKSRADSEAQKAKNAANRKGPKKVRGGVFIWNAPVGTRVYMQRTAEGEWTGTIETVHGNAEAKLDGPTTLLKLLGKKVMESVLDFTKPTGQTEQEVGINTETQEVSPS